MTTSNTQELETAKATTGAKEPEAPTKGRTAASKPRVVHKSANKTATANKGLKARQKTSSARAGTKTSKLLELLKRPGGATLNKLMKTTGWQSHSVRGFLSGTVAKKMGLKVTSDKGENGERTYSVKA
jgi:hypothetical protein